MQFNITNEQKKKMLEDSKDGIHSELYLLMIKMGVDPDTYTLGDNLEDSVKFAGEKYRFDGLVAALMNIEEKIAELS
jgi:hypothetical protein